MPSKESIPWDFVQKYSDTLPPYLGLIKLGHVSLIRDPLPPTCIWDIFGFLFELLANAEYTPLFIVKFM